METSGFWDNKDKANTTLKEKSSIERSLKDWGALAKRLSDLEAMADLASEEGGESMHAEMEREIASMLKDITSAEISALLSGEQDASNAIVSIHPGAGGTEAQDWAEMLMRMYLRWAEKRGYKTEILDYQNGEEAGVKSVTFTVSGDYAYGKMKAEAGVHRLVRISPFDANKRRHTSFASVYVYPEVEEDIDIVIDEKDLRIDTYRASSAGGQHVNKTDSAVRITHLPTNIVVQCQNERSQLKNKNVAMKVLRSRLYELRKKEHEEKLGKLVSEKKDIAWGSQIRSYVFQPYQMVKDHRTGVEVGQCARRDGRRYRAVHRCISHLCERQGNYIGRQKSTIVNRTGRGVRRKAIILFCRDLLLTSHTFLIVISLSSAAIGHQHIS